MSDIHTFEASICTTYVRGLHLYHDGRMDSRFASGSVVGRGVGSVVGSGVVCCGARMLRCGGAINAWAL